MYTIISKLASTLIDPLGFALIVMTVATVLAFFLRRRKWVFVPPALFLFGFLTLAIFSLPITSHLLMRGLEKKYPPITSFEPASAVVILGGGTIGKNPPRTHVELNYSGNRVLHGARVFRESDSPKIVLTGGIVSAVSDATESDAVNMFELLTELFGIDTVDVILEPRSLNTRENAMFTMELFKRNGLDKDIILVTSAFHMPRAAAVFRKAGFDVTCAPAGFFENEKFTRKVLMWQPSSKALSISTIAIREYIGMLAYKIAGWI